jgi:CBS domain-containing protein
MARTVEEIMTRQPATVGQRDSVAQAARLMKDNDTGDVAVVEDGRLLGMISLGDLAIERDPEPGLADISAAESNE